MPHAAQAYLPHRPPFLFVDTLIEAGPDAGHFSLQLAPNDVRLVRGALPALLLVEALAQSTAAWNGYHGAQTGAAAERGVLVEIQHAELHADAHAGDAVDLAISREHVFGNLVRFVGHARVGERLLVSATFTIAREATT